MDKHAIIVLPLIPNNSYNNSLLMTRKGIRTVVRYETVARTKIMQLNSFRGGTYSSTIKCGPNKTACEATVANYLTTIMESITNSFGVTPFDEHRTKPPTISSANGTVQLIRRAD